MTNVLVTGCTGFVGSNLTISLVQEGYNVYGLVRHTSKRELDSLGTALDKVHLIEGDLTAYHSVKSAITSSNPQFVLHLGALTPVRLSFENPFPYVSVNYEGTSNVVHAILESAPKSRLIYASTAEVYGWQRKREPFREDIALNPASPYAVSKEAADQYVRMAMKVYGLNATVIRPINTYGRKKEKGFFVEYVIACVLKGETCYVGAPDSVRDYMFIEDHVNAYLKAMESERANGEVFNVSPGNPVRNSEVLAKLEEMLAVKTKVAWGGYPPGYAQRPAAWDPEYLALDSTKIGKTIGWQARVRLEEGLARTVENWRAANP